MKKNLLMLTGSLASLLKCYQQRNGRWRDSILATFVSRGDLAFDIGAHVGDCVSSFRRLGANVIAVEPQPGMFSILRLLYGWDRHVVLEKVAVGARVGSGEMQVNLVNPTVSTMSPQFVDAAREAVGWEQQKWDDRLLVEMRTLDDLIAQYGEPVFCKIDVEGYEAEVLRGLSWPLASLSFEFTTIQRSVALLALAECERLGRYVYNAAIGDSDEMAHSDWVDAEAMGVWLRGLPHAANSGDIYALRSTGNRGSAATDGRLNE